jgi:hypothetical protein
VEHEALQNLRPGVRSPYNACTDYQRFVSALAYNSNSTPTTRVSDDGMFITFGSSTLSIAKWREGLQQLSSEITEELDQLCDHQDFGLAIPEKSSDDWGNEMRGYGWTTTADYLPDRRALLKNMLKDPSQHLAYLDPHGQLQIGRPEAWGFLHKCDLIIEKLALFAFLTAGQPPRITEFIDDKYANSTRPRNMFRDHDSLWLVTRRVKSESFAQRDTFIPIKCHPQLTKLFERYLLIVCPVEAELVYHVKGEAAYHTYREFLWTKSGARMTSSDMYQSIKDFMSNYCEVEIGAHDYRQIAVEIGRVFLGSEDEVNRQDLDVLAMQSGHTASMAQRKYALEVGHIPAMSSDLLLRYGRASELWWEVVGFKPNTPPMLPLRTRMRLPHAPQATALGSGNAALAPIDIQTLFQQQTAFLLSEMQKLATTIRTEAQSAVAEGLATLHTHPAHHTTSTSSDPQPFYHSPSTLLPKIIPPANDRQPMDTTLDEDTIVMTCMCPILSLSSNRSLLLLQPPPLPHLLLKPCLHLRLQTSFNVDQSCLPIFSKTIHLIIQVNMSGITFTSSWLITFPINTLLQHSNHLSRCMQSAWHWKPRRTLCSYCQLEVGRVLCSLCQLCMRKDVRLLLWSLIRPC